MLAGGIAAMYGMQIATQEKTNAAIENLATKVAGYQRQQSDTNTYMQSQIDECRRQASGARAAADEATVVLAELKGLLIGSGIKNIPLTKTGGR